MVSYDTAEQSLVSQSEVAGRHNRHSLSVSGTNPEMLALAVQNNSNQTNPEPLRLNLPHNLA